MTILNAITDSIDQVLRISTLRLIEKAKGSGKTCGLASNKFNGMMLSQQLSGDLTMAVGKFLVITGAVALVIGIILIYAPWLINWFGRLPGDIRIEDDNKRVYVPLLSMFIVSIVLTLIVNLFFRR